MILENKNILVTGGGKGIGFSTILEAEKEGAYVYAIIKSKKDSKKFKNIKNIKIFYGNVSDKNLIDKIFAKSIKDNRLISGVVNNAGIRQRLKFGKIDKKKLHNIFEINFFSIFYIMQAFSNYLIKIKKTGSIVNIGSIVGKNGFSQLVGYASTKSALEGLTRSFAIEMASKKIRANVINPGFVKTSYYKKFRKKKKLYNWTLSRTSMKRWGEPLEISSVINYLLSDKSEYITGECINVDGGWISP